MYERSHINVLKEIPQIYHHLATQYSKHIPVKMSSTKNKDPCKINKGELPSLKANEGLSVRGEERNRYGTKNRRVYWYVLSVIRVGGTTLLSYLQPIFKTPLTNFFRLRRSNEKQEGRWTLRSIYHL